jgi:hypothetical protein
VPSAKNGALSFLRVAHTAMKFDSVDDDEASSRCREETLADSSKPAFPSVQSGLWTEYKKLDMCLHQLTEWTHPMDTLRCEVTGFHTWSLLQSCCHCHCALRYGPFYLILWSLTHNHLVASLSFYQVNFPTPLAHSPLS